MTCKHERISVRSLHDATCDLCGDQVEMESLDRGDGRPFYWQKTAAALRTPAHPANDPAFYERSPNEWVKKE